MIWIQWVVGHLHDRDYIDFFRSCVRGLSPDGVVVLKDNTLDEWTFVVDRADSSVTRWVRTRRGNSIVALWNLIVFDLSECLRCVLSCCVQSQEPCVQSHFV